ncbi:MAG: HD domain-containing protein [Chloroflexaceae bacterium]|nr:HD domain-containing protein [Chloroflexaceae bacterium]
MHDIARYLYEMGHLKQVRRAGWWIAGVHTPESVAEHSFRTAILGYILAMLEGADADTTMRMCLFHDTPESRVTDLDRVAQRYLQAVKASEAQVFEEQMTRLPAVIADALRATMAEAAQRETSLEARVAKDADRLECLIQAREYQARGYRDAEDWIRNNYAELMTDSARQLADACLELEPGSWWRGLKLMPDTNVSADEQRES